MSSESLTNTVILALNFALVALSDFWHARTVTSPANHLMLLALHICCHDVQRGSLAWSTRVE